MMRNQLCPCRGRLALPIAARPGGGGWLLAVLAAVACAAGALPAAGAESAAERFDRTIAPLLAARCHDCHNATEKKGGLDLTRRAALLAGGDSGPALDLAKPTESLLLQRVVDGEMPPKRPLPEGERAALRAWLASGAVWGTDPIDAFRFTTAHRAGYDWWSLQPLRRPALPAVARAEWCATPVDRFLLARLEAEKLTPAPPAARRTLIRRATYDLLGLLPTPEEIEAFERDEAPDAYERLVDRLLASPHFGVRWARHWLDVVRFGESQGFERDKLRTNAWPYRDWVVRAFAGDLPYDEFARRQLAGDVLAPDDPEAVLATGFLVAGAYDEVGQTQQSAAMRAIVRQDELEDIVGAVGQTFLGLTVNCARCHDHKFDPVRQAEYYRLCASLAGVRHGERQVALGSAAERAAANQELAAAVAELQQLEEPIRARILEERRTAAAGAAQPAAGRTPLPIADWEFDENLDDGVGALHAAAHGGAKLAHGRLELDGREAYAASGKIVKDLTAKTLVAWVRLANLEQRGGAAISLQTLDGGVFDAIVFGEREPGKWMAGSNGFVRTKDLAGAPRETAGPNQTVHVAAVYAEDGTITFYRDGQPYGEPYASSGPVRFKAGEAQVVFGLRHAPVGGNKMLAGAIERAQLFHRALSAEEVAASAGTAPLRVADAELAARLTPEQRARRQALAGRIAALRQRLASTAAMKVYLPTPAAPEPSFVLIRGNPAQRGAAVAAGGVAALTGVDADFALADNAPEGERRRHLARWIADARNPLFARVMVNRLWHHHFGVGLVDTPNDFGFNGGRPTHPELLDWLASELVAGGWRLKPIHRAIVLSAAYRQAAQIDAENQRRDAGNRLLWRRTPQRLDAESLRDALLQAAGELNETLGGPGFQDFKTFTQNSQFYVPIDVDGPEFQRRSLYRTWVRSGRNQFLDVFDCPDPSTKTPARAVTTTPLQALALLNNAFVLRMAERLAARAEREAGDDPVRQVERVLQIALGRRFQGWDEVDALVAFRRQHGLAALCRLLFNSNEFVYVD